MDPTVSVIVLTYNHQDFIEACLKGVLAQRGDFDFEVIVSDDASTDRTADLAGKIAGSDDRVRLFRQPQNLGPARNFEFALFQCRGKFISYCEGDDLWVHPEKISAQAKILMAHPETDIVYSDYKKIDETGEILEKSVLGEGKLEFHLNDLITGHGPSMNSVMVRKEVLPEHFPKAFRKVPNPDVFIIAAALLRSPGRRVRGIFSMYRVHGGGIWSGRSVLEKNLIRYSTLLSVFRSLPGNRHDELKQISNLLEGALLTARRNDKELFDQYWKHLPISRRLDLHAKWLYARFHMGNR